MMIKFEDVKIYNFMGAIRNMRNSWESWNKMDSYNDMDYSNPLINVEKFQLGEADRTLAKKLIKAGSDR